MYETEIYLIDGKQLIAEDKYMPNRHEEGTTYVTSDKQRNEEGTIKFYERIGGNLIKYERIGDNPATYRWLVTLPNGTKNWYGGISAVDPSFTLGSSNGIAKWLLTKSEDVFGNYITYLYSPKVGIAGPLTGGINKYLDKIVYTGHGITEGLYTVTFTYNSAFTRKDVNINNRYGFKLIDDVLMHQIQIKYDGQSVRSYEFEYEEGLFLKLY